MNAVVSAPIVIRVMLTVFIVSGYPHFQWKVHPNLISSLNPPIFLIGQSVGIGCLIILRLRARARVAHAHEETTLKYRRFQHWREGDEEVNREDEEF